MEPSKDPIAFARYRRVNRSTNEHLLWQLLRNRQLCRVKFRREHPLPPYTLDFYAAEIRLAIELDGKGHWTSQGKSYDAARDAYLAKHGIEVLRFRGFDVEQQANQVLLQIQIAIEKRLGDKR